LDRVPSTDIEVENIKLEIVDPFHESETLSTTSTTKSKTKSKKSGRKNKKQKAKTKRRRSKRIANLRKK
jgi:hypothetical protein